MERIHYHNWATVEQLKHLLSLPREVFSKKLAGTFSSISETVSHIYLVDQIWCKRINPPFTINDVSFDSPHQAIEAFAALHQQIIEFLKNTEQDEVVYQNSKGERFSNKLTDILQHLANHGTYHRGNISTMIRQLGYEGVSTDYIYYLRQQKN